MPSNIVSEDGASVDNFIGKVKSLAILEESLEGDANTNCDECLTVMKIKRLTDIQMIVYHKLHTLIDGDVNKVILIDSPSGTGKTHILSTFAERSTGTIQFIVFRRDQASDLMLKQISSYTYVSYNMHNFNLKYHEALRLFTVHDGNNIDILYRLLICANSYVHVSHTIKVIILDTYTIVSPLMLLLLYIVCLKNKITLIFSGNKIQLCSINNIPWLHNRSNFNILETFSDLIIHELSANLRSSDKKFLEKVTCFGSQIANYKTRKQIPFHFNLRYLLYSLFRDKYDPRIEENFQALYMASFHHDITKRLYRFMNAQSIAEYQIEPFSPLSFNYDQKNKFLPGLLLVPNFKYIHVTDQGVHNVVVLESMIFDNQKQLSALIIRFSDNSKLTIKRCPLNYYQILPAYRKWLLNKMRNTKKENFEIINFPLKPYTMTYHAALGHTINDPVELSTECVDASTIYVGLCCLSSESNIYKFHADEDFLSFVTTDFMATVDNQEYYYRYPQNMASFNILNYLDSKDGDEYIKSHLMEISWITTTDINIFENKKPKDFLRIKRSIYEKNRKKVKAIEPSPLMEIAKFIKDNPTVIVDTIKNTRLAKKVNAENFKLKECRTLASYESLNKAYAEWLKYEKEKDKKL